MKITNEKKLTVCVLFLVIAFFWFKVDAGNEVKRLSNEIVDIKNEVSTFQNVSNDILLYKNIQDIWFDYGAEYMSDKVLRDLSLITYRYHKKYGTDGEIPIGLDYGLIFAVVAIESGFDPLIESYAGATGLMQIMPITGVDWLSRYFDMDGLTFKQVGDYLDDPLWNFRIGLEGLVGHQQRFINMGVANSGDWKLALSIYNWSTEAVYNLMNAYKGGDSKASLRYALSIEKRMKEFAE